MNLRKFEEKNQRRRWQNKRGLRIGTWYVRTLRNAYKPDDLIVAAK
jgi:hypothetical protein